MKQAAVAASQRGKLVAIALGILAAGIPVGLFHYWVGHYIDREGQEEIANTAVERA